MLLPKQITALLTLLLVKMIRGLVGYFNLRAAGGFKQLQSSKCFSLLEYLCCHCNKYNKINMPKLLCRLHHLQFCASQLFRPKHYEIIARCDQMTQKCYRLLPFYKTPLQKQPNWALSSSHRNKSDSHRNLWICGFI